MGFPVGVQSQGAQLQISAHICFYLNQVVGTRDFHQMQMCSKACCLLIHRCEHTLSRLLKSATPCCLSVSASLPHLDWICRLKAATFMWQPLMTSITLLFWKSAM